MKNNSKLSTFFFYTFLFLLILIPYFTYIFVNTVDWDLIRWTMFLKTYTKHTIPLLFFFFRAAVEQAFIIPVENFFNLFLPIWNHFWSQPQVLILIKGVLFILLDTPLAVIICLLVSVALMTQVERLIIGKIQRRSGPVKVGISGILQAFADALKLALKETFNPKNANIYLFIFSPIITLILSITLWTFISFDDTVLATNPSIGFLFILGISGLSVFTIFTAGWASNSRFAFLGALRAVAQMVAYELCLGTIVITVCFLTGSYSLNEFSIKQEEQWFILPFFFLFQLFFISALAETNRHPFDLPEAEAELVSGYNVEYSGMRFAFFFLAEYANILFMSGLTVTMFLGGWQPAFDFFLFDLIPPAAWFSMKLVLIVFLFTLVRAAFPRFRYDQLMILIWKRLLPLSLALFLFHVTLGLAIGSLPPFF